MVGLSTIAVIRTDRLGDMVLTLPMFGALRHRFPHAKLVLFTRRYVQDLVVGIPEIDEVVFVDNEGGSLSTMMRSYRIDAAFFPRPRFNEVLAAVRAGIPMRIGSAYRWYSLLFTHRVHDHRSRALYHEAEYNVRMIAAAFGGSDTPAQLLPLPIPPPEPSGVFVIVHPGSGGSARDWPAERFGELAARLMQHGVAVAVTGVESDRSARNAVLKACPSAIDYCGKLSLRELMITCANASLVCANSTGTIHVAAAAGTPVLGFYPTSPSISKHRWGPLTSNAIVLESGAGDDMMTITVDAAFNAAMTLLQLRAIS